MTELERLERRLLELTGRFDLRPTLERAADIGDLLIEAKGLLPHGEWAGWLARIGLRQRTSNDYVSVAKARTANWWPAANLPMTIKGFLRSIRRANRAAQMAAQEEARAEARKVRGDLPDTIVLGHADCREYPWPRGIDLVVADPPWSDLEAYRWLASWASEHLQEGGLAIVQCGQHQMPQVMALLGDRLSYLWTLAIVYAETQNVAANGRFRPGWRSVLVYSKGRTVIPSSLSDTYTVRLPTPKTHHEWEQPAGPWRYWLSRLIGPGSLVADPFAGSGTLAVVSHELGLRYIGTERDRKTFQVARGRLIKAIED